MTTTPSDEQKTVGREQLVRRIATQAGITQKEAQAVLTATLDAIREALAEGSEVRLVDFGTFKVAVSAARKGVNPRDRSPIAIPAKARVRFTPGKKLSQAATGGLV